MATRRRSNSARCALKALRQAMIEADQSRRYVNENIHRIRKVFRWAASEQLIPAIGAASPGDCRGAAEGPQRRPVNRFLLRRSRTRSSRRLLPHLPSVVADMVRLQRLTGPVPVKSARYGRDVDRNGEIWRYVPAEHKTEHHGKQRMIFIGPKAQGFCCPICCVTRRSLLCPCRIRKTAPSRPPRASRYPADVRQSTPALSANVAGGERPASNTRTPPTAVP